MTVRDGIRYERMPEGVDAGDAFSVESVRAQPGESFKQGALRLLDDIHHAATDVNAQIVWVGKLIFSEDKRMASAVCVYMR